MYQKTREELFNKMDRILKGLDKYPKMSGDVVKIALEPIFTSAKFLLEKGEEDALILHKILHEPNKPVYAGFWERDCDMSEGTFSRKFDNELEYQRYLVEWHKDAEGPQSSWRMTPEEFGEFESSFRDRALEAFENGRGNAVFV